MTTYARNFVAVSGQQQQTPQQLQQFQQSQQIQITPSIRRHVSKHQFVVELSQCLFDFVVQLLPTPEELAVKEDVRKLLEKLIRTIEPNSRLLSFGSTANGFSLRNSDMDLCCLIDSEERLSASDLVTILGDLLERETKFKVKPLPHARIPIVKLSLDPSSPGLPHGIACDIGFENRLALENTRLLMCYAMVDPARVRTLVLFLKVWSKRRKINSPYEGTLSSYGYVLLVIYFLVHVKNPPVLPNLQQIPPLRPIPRDEYYMGDHNVWFFDDIDVLRQRWQSSNTESVAELLIDFFRYYSRDFLYNSGVASIRAGLLQKESKGWQNQSDSRPDLRERNRLCIEDPFETDYNVARCVTKDGLYTIRGEFMRASRILASRPERALLALTQLCEERKDDDVVRAPPSNKPYTRPRLSIPPQTPYAIGANSQRSNGTYEPERLSPPRQFFENRSPTLLPPVVPSRSPPEHMAPKRGKWTSPPPPEAPPDDHTSFEDRLGFGLSLATSSLEAREQDKAYLSSSSNNSEILTDDEHPASDIALEDDVHSVRSFTEEPSSRVDAYTIGRSPLPKRSPYSATEISPPSAAFTPTKANNFRQTEHGLPTPGGFRGRRPARLLQDSFAAMPPISSPRQSKDFYPPLPQLAGGPRRSASGPARTNLARIPFALNQGILPARPLVALATPKVYYETAPLTSHTQPARINTTTTTGKPAYPTTPQSPINPFSLYHTQFYIAGGQMYSDNNNSDLAASPMAPMRSSKMTAAAAASFGAGPSTPKPTCTSYAHPSHSHTHSNSTIIAPTTPSASAGTFRVPTPPPSPPENPSSPIPAPSRRPTNHLTAPQSPSSERISFGSPASPSVESVSPPSTSSSPNHSAGYASPASSTSPRSADFGSPELEPPATAPPLEHSESTATIHPYPDGRDSPPLKEPPSVPDEQPHETVQTNAETGADTEISVPPITQQPEEEPEHPL
ncbi:hypothetical protein BD410DRAFT_763019 [Rickenella mellea]|uniref:polynucleotide adenylyltransferase n=1 Tax=Rickenella mellea TaxID=50990 RepID=A0A4Y7QI03_9AGAM|nr:hypothetical protein BD410DRAFT_763019 [Rickenella mellea]